MGPIAGETCGICGETVSSQVFAVGVAPCPACQESRPSFTRAVAYGSYDGELRELIHLLKYDGVVPAAKVLGRMLAQAIQKLDLAPGPLLVIPVPLHRSKKRQRGFNQAELIARKALRRLSLPDAQLASGILARSRTTASQIGLTRPQRAENIRGAFRVAHPGKVAGRNVLLVDDVLTTGTTVSECARILRKAGAKEVWVATAARTLKDTATAVSREPELAAAAGS